MPAKRKEAAEAAEEVYDVEQIADDRVVDGKKQYLIKWEGYPSSQNTWEDRDNLFCSELVEEYEARKRKGAVRKRAPPARRQAPAFEKRVTNEWAGVVKQVTAVYKDDQGALVVEYLTTDGQTAIAAAGVMHQKAPVKLLEFYETHLSFPDE